MYSGETTVSKDILESVLRGGDILKVRGLYRPKENEPNKKLVKLHQKHDPAKQQATTQQQNVIVPGVNRVEEKKVVVEKEKTVVEKDTTTKDAVVEKQQQKEVPQPPPAAALDETSKTSDEMPYLVIKEEPLEWNEVVESEMELIDEHEFHTEMTIKPEVLMEQESSTPSEELYTPLTCELCSETFMIPADWVKHIQSHTDNLPAKRQRRGRSSAVSQYSDLSK